MDIKRLVNRLVRRYGTRNPFELCDYLNVLTIFSDLGDEVRGLYRYYNRKKIIFINSLLESNEQKRVCCHELGHALMHPKVNTFFLETFTYMPRDKYEIEANTFAAELLVADEDIKQYFGTGYSLDHIAKDLGVHESLVEYKIKNMSNC